MDDSIWALFKQIYEPMLIQQINDSAYYLKANLWFYNHMPDLWVNPNSGCVILNEDMPWELKPEEDLRVPAGYVARKVN